MGRYVLVEDLALPLGWNALAERAAPDDADVDGAALQASSPTPAAAAARSAIERQIDQAEAIVDSYVLAAEPGYDEPQRTSGDPLSAVGVRAYDIAVERVFGPGTEADDFDRRARAEAAREWLRGVAAGEIRLADADGDGEPDDDGAAGDGGILIDAPERVFTRKSLAGYVSSGLGGTR